MVVQLKDLIVPDEDLAERELLPLLEPYLRFTDRGELLQCPPIDALTTEARVACVLLALKALSLLGLRASPSATPAEIGKLSGLPGGTVRPKLRSLLRDRCIARAADGTYSVPPSVIHRAAAVVRRAG